MFRSILEKFAGRSISFNSWVLSLLGIVGIRTVLEHYSSFQTDHFVLIDLSTVIHYVVFYVAILLICSAILVVCTRWPIQKIAPLSLVFITTIWLPPIIDLIVSGGKGYLMSYLFIQKSQILWAYLTEFWSTPFVGITVGLRCEIALITIFFFLTIFTITRNKLRSFLGAFAIYTILFFIAVIPSLLAWIGGPSGGSVLFYFGDIINHSNLLNNIVYPLTSTTALRFVDIGFNTIMTQIELLLSMIALAVIFAKSSPAKFKAVLKNFRPEKALFYILPIIAGVLVGMYGSNLHNFFSSWVNILSLVMVIIAFGSAWVAAVCINDIHDAKIDNISNTARPLQTGQMTKEDLLLVAQIFTGIACLAAFSASMYSFFFVLLYLLLSYIYSAEPLRLRAYFPIGNLFIGGAATNAFLSGFFLSHVDQNLTAFPPLGVLCIMIGLSAMLMVKDIKDIDGDRADGVHTLPTLIGLKKAKIIISLCSTIVLVASAIYLANPILEGAAVVASAAIWKILLSKVYHEFHFFVVYTAYVLMVIVVLIP